MRKIKFRAWNKRTKEWVNSFCISDFGSIATEGRDGHEAIEFDDDAIDVMQSTGIKDNKRKEVYEGDLVASDYGVGRVVYDYGSYLVNLSSFIRIKDCMRNYIQFTEIVDNFTVVGNIYEPATTTEADHV